MIARESVRVTSPAVEKGEQYNLMQILGIWALAALPMGLLAWVVAPAMIPMIPLHPGITYWCLIIVGMVWQFVLSLVILNHELGTLRWEDIRRRIWLNAPIDPHTGHRSMKMFWWLVPALLFSALVSLGLNNLLDAPTSRLFPMPVYADISQLAQPEFQGQWWILGIALISVLFNYFLGEELLFRGVLLPKMNGVFGRWDWVANAVLFGFYHLHKPWMWPSLIVSTLAVTWPTRRFRSIWMGIIVHGVEGTFLIVIVLGVVLGLAG